MLKSLTYTARQVRRVCIECEMNRTVTRNTRRTIHLDKLPFLSTVTQSEGSKVCHKSKRPIFVKSKLNLEHLASFVTV